jgi:hypothetical protein
MSRTLTALGFGALAALYAVGCGGAAPPTAARTNAVASIRAARTIGAERTPDAAYHLELADEQLARGDTLIRHGEMERARRTLVRAQVDADLAVALAREDQLKARARETRDRIRQMREAQL